MHLHEAHLPVSDTEAAQRFYVEIVGLQFAHHDLTRDIVFLWAGADRKSMLGLWGPSREVACAIPGASGVPIRLSAETVDSTARQICG
jgi:predicted enzyme related to lactoylglutathione lyase